MRHSAGDTPLLVVPALRGHDGVDGTTLRFLVKKALDRQKEEEKVKRNEEEKEERRMKRINEMIRLDLPVSLQEREDWRRWIAPSSSSSSGKRRKRKKRRKRRTPRTSSLPGRARRRQWQRHVFVSPFDMWSMSLLCGTCSFHRCNDEICADYYIYFRFKLIGKGRSEQWEVFLYCDKTIKVDRDCAEVSPRAVPPFALGGVGFGLSPNLDTKLTIYELCLPSERGCVEFSCGGGFFTPGGAYDSVCDMVKPMTGKYFVNYFQYQEFVGCVCMLNSWFSNNDEICADNYFFLVQVDGQCRSEKWDLYLYGDMTIKVDRDFVT